MKILCISASNMKHSAACSTSTRICESICDMMRKQHGESIGTEIIALSGYEPRPCTGCGACFRLRECADDDDFNTIYAAMAGCDALFIVSAHYAPIPSKLCMLLEKTEQMAFLPRFHDGNDLSPLYGKPVGIIAHGGGTGEIITQYRGLVLDVIANALSWPVGMDITGINEMEWPNGIALPVKSVHKENEILFPVQEYDWEEMDCRIKRLVAAVLVKLASRSGIRQGAAACGSI